MHTAPLLVAWDAPNAAPWNVGLPVWDTPDPTPWDVSANNHSRTHYPTTETLLAPPRQLLLGAAKELGMFGDDLPHPRTVAAPRYVKITRCHHGTAKQPENSEITGKRRLSAPGGAA